MTTHNGPEQARRLWRTLGIGFGLSLALLANLGDRAFSASAANAGIDPLQVLDTAIKNNILFMVGTSGTMGGTVQDGTAIVGGGDPASRFYQVKRALREVIAANAGKANFGLAAFHPDYNQHLIDGSQGLVYVTQDPSGDRYRNNFVGGTPVTYRDSCAAGTSCTATESNDIFTELTSNDAGTSAAYPQGCTPQTTNQVAANGTVNPPITHVLGTPATNAQYAANPLINIGSNCRYYVKSKSMLNSRRFQVFRGQGSTTAIRGSSTIACPPPPPGLVGDDVLAAADGSKARACFQVQDVTTGLMMSERGTALYSTTRSTTYTGAAAWTPAATTLLVAFVVGAGSVVDPTDVTGHGLTYTKVTLPANTISTTHAMSVWVAKAGASPTSDAASVTFAATALGAALVEYEVAGADLSGILPTAAIVQAVTSNGTGTVASTTLLAGSTANGVMYFVSHLAAEGATPNALWTEGSDGSFINPVTGVEIQTRLSYNSPATASWLTSSAWRGIALEIKLIPPTTSITTYWLTGTKFISAPAPSPTPVNQNNQSGIISVRGIPRPGADVAACNTDNSAEINSFLRTELQYDQPGGAPRDVPALTDLSNRQPNISESPAFSLSATAPFINPGIRLGSGNPLAPSMNSALAYFQNNVLNTAGSLSRPLAAQGKQKQFVVLLTDGDDSSGTQATANTAAFNLWNNTAPALPACNAACLASKGITADQWSVANRVELVLVTFGGGTPANVDAISKAGTGFNAGVCTKLYPSSSTNNTLSPCRTSFIANTFDELVTALNAAVDTTTQTGEFSDQQSVTESVFEFASVGSPSRDPLDPEDRYAVSVPVLLQSTFEQPDWMGHLNAFRRGDNGTPLNVNDDVSIQAWDAGQLLRDRLANPTTGMGTSARYFFSDLYGDATLTPSANNVRVSTAKIKRRIFTTTQNGVNPNYNVANLLDPTGNAAALAWTRVSLWPPSVGSTDNLFVAPDATGTGAAPIRGILDTAMGFDALTTVARVQLAVPGACQGTVAADIHPDCTSLTAGVPLARAKREAREIVLAYLAGAMVDRQNGLPVRTAGSGGVAANRARLQYVIRPWIMAESTLAAPGVVTPPLLAGPKNTAGAVGVNEYKDYRDGVRTSTGAPVNGLINGLGLRNPDRLAGATAQSIKDAAAADLTLKPVMSVVYHATNQGLHAFRAGPCPTPPAVAGFATPVAGCGVSLEDTTRREMGGEELWAFVPYDLLSKLPALTKSQSRTNKQYLLASPVRFTDVFVPGGGNFGGKSFAGVWRTLLYFGRGQGGKYYTALDITAAGPFTRHSLNTELPPLVWSRGNPDTPTGVTTAGGPYNNTTNGVGDYNAYLKMGETWSLPGVGFVTAANYTTARSGVNGRNFVLFTGSGYSDTLTEGKTFYVLDALTGDVVRNFDIPDGRPAALPPPNTVLTNFLVAPPVVYAEDSDGNSPSGYRFIGNPISAKAKTVYFGDLHSRIWRYDANSPAAAPTVFFQANTATDGNQPFATAVSVLQNRPDLAAAGDVLVYAEAGHDRRAPVPADVRGALPFQAYALKDPGGSGALVFTRAFETNYRGTTQPATTFVVSPPPGAPAPVVFYAGTKFGSTDCVGTFDSILIALKGVVSSAGAPPEAAFDLRATGDDAFIEFVGKKINAIRVSGEGSLVVDQGLNAQNPPPPPGVAVVAETVAGSTSLVSVGLVPGSTQYKHLSATTVPYRIGSSVCRTEY